MMCSFGMAPSSLIVLPINRVNTNMVPDANIMDHVPITNIPPFGMCITPSNPAVASHRRRTGRADTDAVRAGYTRAMGGGRAQRDAGQPAHAR